MMFKSPVWALMLMLGFLLVMGFASAAGTPVFNITSPINGSTQASSTIYHEVNVSNVTADEVLELNVYYFKYVAGEFVFIASLPLQYETYSTGSVLTDAYGEGLYVVYASVTTADGTFYSNLHWVTVDYDYNVPHKFKIKCNASPINSKCKIKGYSSGSKFRLRGFL